MASGRALGIWLCAAACLLACGRASASDGGHGMRARRPAHAHRKHHRAPSPPTTKALIVGLVDKGSQAPYTHREPWPTATPSEVAPDAGAFAGIVVNETWAQLEPTEGRYTLKPLERSLDAVQAYNRSHRHHQLEVKLRLWGGFTAPAWAKTLGGAPVSFDTPSASGTTGRWWTMAYRSAWSTFQHHLASRFDRDPLIHAVAVTSCMTLTAEPFVFSPNASLHAELFADGWSSAAQQACLLGAYSDYSGWKHTPIDYTFNPFVDYAQGTNRAARDTAFTDEAMTRCAELHSASGRSCILSNHALDSSAATTSASAPVYAEIDMLHAEHPHETLVDFQTASPDTFGGCSAIDVAIEHHGQSVELWPPSPIFKGYSAFSSSELAQWAHALRTQTRLSC